MKAFLTLALAVVTLASPKTPDLPKPEKLYKKLAGYCQVLPQEFAQITEERKATLTALGNYIAERKSAGQPVAITVICTHNSRRSHMGQLWVAAAAAYYGIDGITAFSGGTAATAFHPNAIAALRRVGFKIEQAYSTANPNYLARWSNQANPLTMFSKKYDDSFNPRANFAAVMVCAEADASCPLVPGAEERFSLPFDDPKHFDNSALMEEKYDEACRLIARELFFAFDVAKKQLILKAEQAKGKASKS